MSGNYRDVGNEDTEEKRGDMYVLEGGGWARGQGGGTTQRLGRTEVG